MAKKINMGTKPLATPDPANPDQWISRGEEDTSAPESLKMKRLTLDISEDLHKAIKTKAVVEGVPMANMLRSLLEQYYGNQ